MTGDVLNRPFLSDKNIFLRPVEPQDAEFMWRVESDSTQWIQNAMVAPLSKENLLRFALDYDADPYKTRQLRLIISIKDGEKDSKQNSYSNQDSCNNLGIVDLFDLSPQNLTAKIGIYIVPNYRNSGIASNALNLLEDYARCLLNLRSLCAEVADCNSASISLFKKAGYTLKGSLSDWIFSAGKTFSLLIFQKSLL